MNSISYSRALYYIVLSFLMVSRTYAQSLELMTPLVHWKDSYTSFVPINECSFIFDNQMSLDYAVPICFSGPVLPDKDALKLIFSDDFLWTVYRFKNWLQSGIAFNLNALDLDKWRCSVNLGEKLGLHISRSF